MGYTIRCCGALLLASMFCLNAIAQELPSDPGARAGILLNDKSGKYIFFDHSEPLLLENDWFSNIQCGTPANGMVTIKVGQSLFRIPQVSLRSVQTGALLTTQLPDGKFRTWHFSNTGCAENPVAASVAEVVQPASGPADTLGLRETPARSGNGRIGATLLSLRDNPNSNCAPLGEEFISCTGQMNGSVTSFIMAKSKDLPLQGNGAPLSLRCHMQPVISCGLDDDLSGGVTMVTTLPGGTNWMRGMTTEKLSAYYREMRAIVDDLRSKN